MYKEHDVFIPPTDTGAKIWRYMDFSKLVDLLISEELYFNRIDNFEDKFDGCINKVTLELVRKQFYEGFNLTPEKAKINFEGFKTFGLFQRKYNYVSCWYKGEFESDAMWKSYTKVNEGIAIQSTFDKLCRSLKDEKKDIYIGEIKYCNFNTTPMPVANSFWPFLHKKESYKHEQEIRALHSFVLPTQDGKIDYSHENEIMGIKVKVDLKTLIDKIYISPYSSRWAGELVNTFLIKLGLKFTVSQSDINTPV